MKMELALAAVPLRDVRPYMKGWNRNNKTVKLLRKFMPRYNKKGYRAYFSLDKAAAVEPKQRISPPMALIAAMQTLGYGITDYLANRCIKVSDPTSKNEFKITSVIAKAKSLNETQRQFYLNLINNDERRQAQKQGKRMLVVSCHPYDIIGMSTGRGWTSCMNIHDGSNSHYVARDLAFGVMVVYAIDADDPNIQHPICRCLIKPFKSKSGNILYHRETRVYGTKVPGFDTVLDKFLRVLNKKAPPDYYEQIEHLYKDGADTSVAHKSHAIPKEVDPYVPNPAPKIPDWFGPDAVGQFLEETNVWFDNGEQSPDFKYVGKTQKEKDFLSLILFCAVNARARVKTSRISGYRLNYEEFDKLMQKYNVKHAWHGGSFSVGDTRYGFIFAPNTLKKYPFLVHYASPAHITADHISNIVDDYMDVDTFTSGVELRNYLDTVLGSCTNEVDHIKVLIGDREPMIEREINRIEMEKPRLDADAIENEFDTYHPGAVEALLEVDPEDQEIDMANVQREAADNVDSRIEVYKDYAGTLADTLGEICEAIEDEMAHAEDQQKELDKDDPEYDELYGAYQEVWDILDDFKSEFRIVYDDASEAASDKY